MRHKSATETNFTLFNQTIDTLLRKQKEANINIEEMYEIVSETDQRDQVEETLKNNDKLVKSFISIADLIEDFYLYYQENFDEIQTLQSKLIWNTTQKIMSECGITRICDEHTPFNYNLNTIQSVEVSADLKDETILKVLKSGYIYNNKVYRKSSVVVNKVGK